MAESGTIEVEVVYALPERQALVAIALPAGATAGDAIEQSGIARQFPEQDLAACQLGIWGRLADRDQLLEDGDRVEVYRTLEIDPREARTAGRRGTGLGTTSDLVRGSSLSRF
jgi:putative ubiquitin-RnfH superfamily antitoxin RatB of RatAB toxin-antitoxin module